MKKANAILTLSNVRGSFVYVANPRTNENGKESYGMQCIIDADDPQVAKIKQAMKKVLSEAFGPEAAKKPKRFKLPLRDPSEEDLDEEHLKGKLFFNANNKKQPSCLKKGNVSMSQEEMEKLCYSGAYYHVQVSFYAFDSRDGGKPGIAVGLQAVKPFKHGERLGGFSVDKDAFSDLGESNMDVDDDLMNDDDDGDEW